MVDLHVIHWTNSPHRGFRSHMDRYDPPLPCSHGHNGHVIVSWSLNRSVPWASSCEQGEDSVMMRVCELSCGVGQRWKFLGSSRLSKNKEHLFLGMWLLLIPKWMAIHPWAYGTQGINYNKRNIKAYETGSEICQGMLGEVVGWGGGGWIWLVDIVYFFFVFVLFLVLWDRFSL